jgi:peptide/nickel transport system substrate-binding protein
MIDLRQDSQQYVRSAGSNLLTRRKALFTAAGAGLALGGGALLSACGGNVKAPAGSASGSTSGALAKGVPALAGGTPVRGGTWKIGILSAGSEENLFPGTAATNPDYVRLYNLYNTLFYPGEGYNLYPAVPGLALSAEPNAAATVWTFHLRPGVEWHNGKPFTADDVVYNFQTLWSNPSLNYSAAFLTGLVDFKNVRKVGPLSVEVPLLSPYGQFPTILTFFSFAVLPEGATAHGTSVSPIGTGPYKYQSFSPGQQSIFTANPHYWETGKPYVDTMIVNSSFTDYTATLDALLSGDLNAIAAPELTQARQEIGGGRVQVLEGVSASQTYAFGMRVDRAPYNDPRVRKAFQLLVNRPVMIDGALAGFGSVGNDLLGPLTEFYDASLSRSQDIDQAKALFKAAGVLGHTFPWPTAQSFVGQAESAAVLAEEASQAGITVTLTTESAGAYFTPAEGAFERVCEQNVMQPIPSLAAQYSAELTKNAPYSDTHWGSQQPGGAAAANLINQAIQTLNPSLAAELWHEVQLAQFNQGGYVIWANAPYVDIAANNVRGLKSGGGFNFNCFRFCDGWLT